MKEVYQRTADLFWRHFILKAVPWNSLIWVKCLFSGNPMCWDRRLSRGRDFRSAPAVLDAGHANRSALSSV